MASRKPALAAGQEGDRQQGVEVRLDQPQAAPAEIEAEADEIVAASSDGSRRAGSGRAGFASILPAIPIAFFNQLSGINAILYFAPRIFELTGLGAKAALLQSVGIGVTNLIFTFVGLWLIDRLGRRTLLYIGSFGYIGSLGLVAWAFFTQHFAIVPVCIFAFIAAHAVGQARSSGVHLGNLPLRHRAEGQTLGCFTDWIFAALLTTFFVFVHRLRPEMSSRFSAA